MANISTTSGGTAELRIGTALSQATSVLMRAPGSFLLLSVIPFIPAIVVTLGGVRPTSLSQVYWTIGIMLVLQILLTFMIQTVIIYGAFQELRGQRFSLGEAMDKGLPRFVPALGASIVTTFLVMLGLIALIIPGIIVAAALYVVIPACVVERAGPIESLSRSAKLTKGFRGKIFGLLLIVTIIGGVLGYLVKLILSQIGGALVGAIGEFAAQTAATAFGAVLVVIIYYTLRMIKEGVDIDKIASVFD
jgi:hypothetical protein